MTAVFADSFYFFALLNRDDAAHQQARAFGRAQKSKLITTMWVLTELADGLAASRSRRKFVELLAQLRESKDVEILPFTPDWFEAGLIFTPAVRTRTGRLPTAFPSSSCASAD